MSKKVEKNVFDDLVEDFDYKPSMKIEEGVKNFVKWYKHYYSL